MVKMLCGANDGNCSATSGKDGDRPRGVYRATLRETLRRFGKRSRQRFAVAQRLERIYRVSVDNGQLARFVVFGSFVSAKREPADVEKEKGSSPFLRKGVKSALSS
ncbi:MAG: hypothetical protein HYY46_21190 [Deltaproteobacteria bacterium]|nr:hypothetical protein [Deltaproteobacteria bacterium]